MITILTRNDTDDHNYVAPGEDGLEPAENDIYQDEFGNVAMGGDSASLANVITNALRTQLGELQYDQSRGIPYLETIFTSRTNIRVWESYMISTIESIPEVIRVESFEKTVNQHTLSYKATILTSLGRISIYG